MESNTVASSVRPALELNDRMLKIAQPGDVLRDANVTGLHVRCFKERKSFYLFYRTKTGQQRKPKLGDAGMITVAQARQAAREMLAEVAAGRDPMADRATARAENTLDQLFEEVYKRHFKKNKSAAETRANYESTVKPALGKRLLSQISYSVLADFMEDLGDTPIMANRMLAMLSKMLAFAVHPLEWIEKNPAKSVSRYKENKRRRYMTADEAARVAAELDARKDTSPAGWAFIYLLILTGARKGEIAAAKWECLHGNVLRLPDSKTGFRQIFLPQAAMEVLDGLPRTTGTITGISDPRDLWRAVAKAADCPDLRIHDLRHSFASVAVSSGLTLAQIGELLGHKTPQTTMRYAHLMEDAATAAASLTADQITLRMRGPIVKDSSLAES